MVSFGTNETVRLPRLAVRQRTQHSSEHMGAWSDGRCHCSDQEIRLSHLRCDTSLIPRCRRVQRESARGPAAVKRARAQGHRAASQMRAPACVSVSEADEQTRRLKLRRAVSRVGQLCPDERRRPRTMDACWQMPERWRSGSPQAKTWCGVEDAEHCGDNAKSTIFQDL